MGDPTCKERWPRQKDAAVADLRMIMLKENLEPEASWDVLTDEERKDWEKHGYTEEEWNDTPLFHEYGLSWDYVPRGTFQDQKMGYFRYQLSWGGPSSEFRFYVDPDFEPHAVEFWFLDWWDGHGEELHGIEYDLLVNVYNRLMLDDPKEFGPEMVRKAKE